jgi:hypothetical protein
MDCGGGKHTELDEVPDGAHDCVCVLAESLLCGRMDRGERGRLRTEETDTNGLGDLDEFAAIGWGDGSC